MFGGGMLTQMLSNAMSSGKNGITLSKWDVEFWNSGGMFAAILVSEILPKDDHFSKNYSIDFCKKK
jgi:hypothetical protein